jgi:hypothetical protein
MMKISMATSIALLALAVSASAQTNTNQNTTETKVGLSTKGIEITRKKTATNKTTGAAARRAAIKVMVDDDAVAFPDQGPVMRGSRVMVPLRGVFEKMGATVNWDRASNTVTANRGDRKVVLPLSGTSATVDGKSMTLDQPAMVMGGRALVPLRFLSESLGASVDWQAANSTVMIKGGS